MLKFLEERMLRTDILVFSKYHSEDYLPLANTIYLQKRDLEIANQVLKLSNTKSGIYCYVTSWDAIGTIQHPYLLPLSNCWSLSLNKQLDILLNILKFPRKLLLTITLKILPIPLLGCLY